MARQLVAGALLFLLPLAAWGEESRNRVSSEITNRVSLSVGSGISYDQGAAAYPGSLLSLQPALALELLIYNHFVLWAQWMFVLNRESRFPMPPVKTGGPGDPRLGILYLAASGPFSFQGGLSYSYPLGIGDPYQVRIYNYSSGSGEHRAGISGGIAFLRDPIAVRLQSECIFGLSRGQWLETRLRRIEFFGAAMLVINSIFSVDTGVGVNVEFPYRATRAGPAQRVQPGAALRSGLIISTKYITARINIQKNLLDPASSYRVDANLGVEWYL